MRLTALVIFAPVLFLTAASAADDHQMRVDTIFSAYNKADSPGCSLGVIQDGSFVYRKSYGEASLELGVPLSSASVFYMGSVSKQFTAASVVLAAEQGYLSLDDDVRKYIPELPDYGHPITLRQMLHHTSGLRDFLSLLDLSGQEAGVIHSDAQIIDLIARQKGLNNVPGDEFIYSNTNYFLLGEVVKRATHKSLEDFAAENIFDPLGMTHTRYYDDHTLVVPGRVAAYAPGKDGGFQVDWSTDYDIVGAGGLMSSVDDLLHWDQNFYHNRLGKGTLLQEMQTRGVLNDGKSISYALGLEIEQYRGLPIVEHSGALYGYRTEILRFPEQRFTVLCLCNLSSTAVTNLSRQVADVYLEKELQKDPGEAGPAHADRFPDPGSFAGRYLDPHTHLIYSFTASGDSLMGWGAKLRRVGANQFRDLGTGTITFTQTGGRMGATLIMDGKTFFAGQTIQAPRLTEADLATYTGRFTSDEIGATYKVAAEGQRMTLQINWNAPMTLMPVAPDEFESAALGTIVFDRDENHHVTGLKIYTMNARGLSFRKADDAR